MTPLNRTRPRYLTYIDGWWARDPADEDTAPFAALVGPSGSGKLDTMRAWASRRTDLGRVAFTDGGFLTGGYFAGLEPLVIDAIRDAEARAPELVARFEQSLKRLFPTVTSHAYRVPKDLTGSSDREERTRFYHYDYQHKLLNGLFEFLVAYHTTIGERTVVVIDDAHALSPTVRSFLRLMVRRRALTPHLRVVLLIDGHGPIPGLPAHTVRFEPLDLAEARELTDGWADVAPPTAKQLEQRWLVAEGNPAAFAALFACAQAGVEAPDRLTLNAHLDFLLSIRGERFRRELLEAHVAAHCTSDDPISRRNYDTYPAPARARLHQDAIGRRAQAAEHGHEPLRFVHHLGLGSTDDQLEVLSIETLLLQEIGLYDAWFEIFSRFFCSAELRVLPDGEQPHNLGFLRMAFVLYSLGLTDVAVPYLDTFYAAFPDSRLTPTALYSQSMAHGRYQVPVDLPTAERYALLNLEKIETIFSGHPKHTYIQVFAENALAYIRARQGRFDEALELCTQGIERMQEVYGPDRYRLHQSILVYNTGQIHEILGDYEQASARYLEAIRMDPYYGEYYNDLANLQRRHGRLQEALENYQRAIDLCPPYYEAHLNRASVHAELGDAQRAEADYRRALELHPAAVGAHLGVGALVLEHGDAERARELFTQALYHAPDDASAYNNRALAHRQLGDAAAALADLDAAIRLKPRFAEAYNNRAAVRFDLGDHEASLRDLDQALLLRDDPDVRRNRAHLFEALGRRADADADLAAATAAAA